MKHIPTPLAPDFATTPLIAIDPDEFDALRQAEWEAQERAINIAAWFAAVGIFTFGLMMLVMLGTFLQRFPIVPILGGLAIITATALLGLVVVVLNLGAVGWLRKR